MGVDTKLFVTTSGDNIINVMPKVIDAVNKWQRNYLDNYWDKKGFQNRISFLSRNKKSGANKDLKEYSNGIKSVETYNFKSFNMYLTVNGESRSVFITHTCGSDYKEVYEGDKIIFSLGCWGMSKEIMMVIGEAVRSFGDVYFAYNDCSGEFKKLFTK